MRCLPALALAALLLAGCASQPAPAPGTSAAPRSAGAYALACPPATAAWPETCAIRASHGPGPKEEVAAGVDPADPRNVVIAAKDLDPAVSDHCVWNGLFVTKDAGGTWTDVHIGGNFSDRQPGDPTYGYACNTDPDLAFAKDGTLYYAVEMYQLSATQGTPAMAGSEFLLATSHDGGLTWPSQAVAELGDGTLALHDYSRMAVSPSTGTPAYAVGTYDVPGFIVGGALPGAPVNGALITVVASHDHGQTADAPVLLTQPTAPGTINIGTIAAAPDGTFVVTGYDVNDGTVYVWTSTDDARTFSGPTKAFQMHMVGSVPNVKFRAFSTTELAFAPDGALYATWADNGTGNADILLARSKDNGQHWDQPVRVSDDPGTHAQWMSNVAVTGDGVVHVLYMDRQWDPQDRLIDLAYATSADGGATWRHARVTDHSFDGDLGVHQDGFPFIGDYLGLSAAGKDVWGGFPDCITGTCVIAGVHARAG